MTTPRLVTIIGSFVCLFLIIPAGAQDTLSVFVAAELPTTTFALEELRSALAQENRALVLTQDQDPTIAISVDPTRDRLQAEGFELLADEKDRWQLVGDDPGGVLYGILELAEQIRLNGWEGVSPTLQNPHFKRRGVKFNIPLDVRTPSYTDASTTAQENIATVWDIDFWKEYIDALARDRFNYVSLWNLHPFPSLVEVPGYEDIALDDVLRSTTQWKEFYHLHGTGLDSRDILKNPETLKKLSMAEKIAFWREVMRYGKERNVDFYFITWNIFTNGTEGQYGITDAIDNETTKDYFRKSVKQLFITYPDLAGIGLTTGENMHGAKFQEKEDWAYDTYAKGVLEVAAEMPDRSFTFIHRQHQTGAREIAQKFRPVIDAPNVNFIYSFKYAKAHAYSATEQPYHEGFIKDIGDLKTIWGIRNDDTYYFRWGAPDFVREFIRNLPISVAEGIYFGSDQWVWGREFLMKDPETPRSLEIDKHWYQWMLWGRLSYNPTLENEHFQKLLAKRFSLDDPTALFSAWQHASMIYPTTTGFHWGALDFQWYIEGCISRPEQAENTSGFHDVNRFITLGVHPKSGFQSIPDYVSMTVADSTSTLDSPLDVSERLHQLADKAMSDLATLDAHDRQELEYTLNDIRTVSFLGKYYAHKTAGSTYVALYRETKDEENKKRAVDELTKALDVWKKYTEQALAQNKNPLWTNRVGIVDWQELTSWVEQDIEIAKQAE